MSTVKKAVVLAAGLGTRLRPFTCVTPKPLMPVWGEPMLSRIVAGLRERGVEDIVVNCHHLHDQVEAWCKANGCRASHEPEILGTGGVLNPLRDWIGEDEFYLVNGDIVLENVPELPAPEGDAIGTCLAVETGPRTLEVEPEFGYVTNWKSDDAGCDGTLTYCGVARLKAEILKYVEPQGFSSIVSAYERAMMDGRFMKTVTSDGLLWSDAGTIASLVELNRDGEDNAFAELPQLRAIGDRHFEFLSARGSDRVFFRSERGIVVLYDDGTRVENALYADQAKYLAAKGISVPAVLEDRPELKLTVYADGGCERKMSPQDYAEVVKLLVKFNALGGAPDLPKLMAPFDAATWRWERDLFAEHCLGQRFLKPMPGDALAELEKVAARLEAEPKALVHRDFQSTNILWGRDRPCFIDFQGMRLGPAAYDLASLVYDPYVQLSDRVRAALVELYARESGRAEIAEVLPFAAVQRLVQCLGAYGRLASVGQPQFGRHVLPALQNLLAAADLAGLDAVGALAEDLIAAETHRREAQPHGRRCNCGHFHR